MDKTDGMIRESDLFSLHIICSIDFVETSMDRLLIDMMIIRILLRNIS